ncbi:MAG: serine hydrolase [Nocardioidaceae bacterium]
MSVTPVTPGLPTALEQCLARTPGAGQATVSVWLGPVAGADPEPVARDADVAHYAASTMKLPLLVAAYRRHERGDLDLDTAVPVHNEFASALDGRRFSMDQADDQDDETWALIGTTCTLRELARHATVKSGNLATNLLLEHVGAGAVADVLADAGCSTATVLPRGIEDAAAREAGMDNLVTAADLALVMRGVAAGTLASPATCAAVEEVLAAQEHRGGIPAGTPAGTHVANKTGWVEDVSHDVALVRPPDRPPYVLAVCLTGPLPEDDATRLIRDISALAWEAWAR